MPKRLLLPLFIFSSLLLHAATIDTVSIYSNAMHQSFNCVVIRPSLKSKHRPLPVVYLLHGYSGRYSDWIRKVPALKAYAEQYHLFIVCPDGGFSSWYLDSPVDSSMRYETYISQEVPAYIDAHYPTIRNRNARAITGLSMGGYGSLLIGFRHAGFFGACGSMSGGVDLNDSRTRFDVSKRVGDTVLHSDNWNNYSIKHVAEIYQPQLAAKIDSLSIIIDCGTEDFFYNGNHSLHGQLLQLHIPHDYIERPGKHDWIYWENAVRYQLMFFSSCFRRAYNN